MRETEYRFDWDATYHQNTMPEIRLLMEVIDRANKDVNKGLHHSETYIETEQGLEEYSSAEALDFLYEMMRLLAKRKNRWLLDEIDAIRGHHELVKKLRGRRGQQTPPSQKG